MELLRRDSSVEEEEEEEEEEGLARANWGGVNKLMKLCSIGGIDEVDDIIDKYARRSAIDILRLDSALQIARVLFFTSFINLKLTDANSQLTTQPILSLSTQPKFRYACLSAPTWSENVVV